MGTPEYMAQEPILGEEVYGRADQYALAVTVFELLSGRFPFVGATSATVIVQQTSLEPPSLLQVRKDIHNTQPHHARTIDTFERRRSPGAQNTDIRLVPSTE